MHPILDEIKSIEKDKIRILKIDVDKDPSIAMKFKIKGVAFAISKNIQKFGIAPTYFYDKAFEVFELEFESEAIKALGIDVETFFDRVVEENLVKVTKK
jgi:hypothetical protein